MKRRLALVLTPLAILAGLSMATASPASALRHYSWCDGNDLIIVSNNGDGTYGSGIVYNSSQC